jgi:hypothetical protein
MQIIISATVFSFSDLNKAISAASAETTSKKVLYEFGYE